MRSRRLGGSVEAPIVWRDFDSDRVAVVAVAGLGEVECVRQGGRSSCLTDDTVHFQTYVRETPSPSGSLTVAVAVSNAFVSGEFEFSDTVAAGGALTTATAAEVTGELWRKPSLPTTRN